MNITEICMDLHNFFPPVSQKANQSYIHRGHFIISGSSIAPLDFIKPNQYFRIVGSDMNDAVWQNNAESLKDLIDEEFDGEIWEMAVPRAFFDLCKEISEWREKYESIDGVNMSPFTSESYTGVYSYTKSSTDSSGATSVTWKKQFANRLNAYRKLNVL